MTAIVLLLVGLAVGFSCGVALSSLLRDDRAPLEPPKVPDGTPPAPRTVVETYEPIAHAVAAQLYLAGVSDGCGETLAPTSIDAHLDRGQKPIGIGARNIALIAGNAYAQGVAELRANLGNCSGIDDEALDQALEVAFERRLVQDERTR